MKAILLTLFLCTGAISASAQVGEISLSLGASTFGSTKLGTAALTAANNAVQNAQATLNSGVNFTARLTLNTKKYIGHEFGYAYNHSALHFTPGISSDQSTPVHQGFYDFLVYVTPEGSRIRPFACGGPHFSSFFPPGTSTYYGNQITKFGVNYGGGVKFKVTDVIGLRADVRQYLTGQPFKFTNQSGKVLQVEISAGVAFLF